MGKASCSVLSRQQALPVGLPSPDEELKADVLVAPYHGLTGAATGFIDKVDPEISIVTPYPIANALPLDAVMNALAATSEVYRTDLDDEACRSGPDKVGDDNDDRLGGCSNVKVTIENNALVAQYVESEP